MYASLDRIKVLWEKVGRKTLEALSKYPLHPTSEHSLTVLLEELEELKDELRLKPNKRSYNRIMDELADLSAAAFRAMIDMDYRQANGFSEV